MSDFLGNCCDCSPGSCLGECWNSCARWATCDCGTDTDNKNKEKEQESEKLVQGGEKTGISAPKSDSMQRFTNLRY